MIDLQRIHPVSDFVRNYRSFLLRLKETGRPEVLTINGVPECVLVEPARFQEMLEAWEQLRFRGAVQEAIDALGEGQGKPVDEAFKDIRKKLEL